MNSQLYIPSTKNRFRELVDYCVQKMHLHEDSCFPKIKKPIHMISFLYDKYCKLMNEQDNNRSGSLIDFDRRIDLTEYDSNIADFLKVFETYCQDNISRFALGIFLHGSLATNDYTGFSDVDAGIFVKNEVMLDPGLLKKLQVRIKGALRLILNFENLQHHGFFIIPEYFLMRYPEEYLPLDSLKLSKVVGTSFEVKLNAKRNKALAYEKYMRIHNFVKDGCREPNNLYEIKHQLSTLMLFPVLYLQAKGTYVYKKKSFDLVKKVIPDSSAVMDEMGEIRRHWNRFSFKLLQMLVHALPNPWYISLIYRQLNWMAFKCFKVGSSDMINKDTICIFSKKIRKTKNGIVSLYKKDTA
jgi:predicted nucleotidyltransferase